MDRTVEEGCGPLVERLMLYAEDKQLSEVEHDKIVQWTLHFEECSNTEDELNRMSDAELIKAAYWVMAEYASGQL